MAKCRPPFASASRKGEMKKIKAIKAIEPIIHEFNLHALKLLEFSKDCRALRFEASEHHRR